MDPGSGLLATASAERLARTPAGGGDCASLVPKRRAKGAGSVFRRADGRWSGSVDLSGAMGSQRRKVVYGASKKEVEERIRRLVNDVADGSPPPSRSPQLGAFLEQWLVAVRPTLRTSTYVSYEGVVRLHLVPEIGRVTLEKLSVEHVAALITHKQADRRLSPATVRYALLVLRNAMNKAVRWGLVGRNLAVLVDPPRVSHKDVRVLSPDETKNYLTRREVRRLRAWSRWPLAQGCDSARRSDFNGLTLISTADSSGSTSRCRGSPGRARF